MGLTNNIAANLSAWMSASASLKTVKAVSDKAKVGFGTVRRCKNGDGNPTINNLADIARAFGRRVEDLLALPPGANLVREEPAAYRTAVLPFPEPAEPLFEELTRIARTISEPGLHRLLERAQVLAEQFPRNAAKAN